MAKANASGSSSSSSSSIFVSATPSSFAVASATDPTAKLSFRLRTRFRFAPACFRRSLFVIEFSSISTVLNHEELRKRGLDAREESAQTGNRAIDVEVRIGPVVVAVEAKHGQTSTNRREAIDASSRRLKQKLAQCAVAVCYPDDTTRESLPHSNLIWSVRDRVDDGTPWTSGDIDQLASVIRLVPAQLGDPDYAAAALSNSLDEAVRRLSETQRQMLARTLDLLSSRSGRGRRATVSWNHAAKRALLVVATAVMFHSRLDTHLAGLRPEHDNRLAEKTPFTGDWPPEMAHRCAHTDDPISAFWDAWDLILALDYKPIFETGCAALHACPPDPAFSGAIRETALAALAVSGSIASLRHDLLGRIFHTVLDSARYDGSFYTTTAAATLLASLAITDDLCDWSDPKAIAKINGTHRTRTVEGGGNLSGYQTPRVRTVREGRSAGVAGGGLRAIPIRGVRILALLPHEQHLSVHRGLQILADDPLG